MKSIFRVLSLAASVLGQSLVISHPTNGQTVMTGQNMVVSLQLPNQLTPVEQVSVAVAYQACHNDPCISTAEDAIGLLLYSGNYSPVYHEQNLPPYQNFTVQIPSGTTPGIGFIDVAHFYLLGAGPQPMLEFKNVSINVQNSTSSRRSYIRGRSV